MHQNERIMSIGNQPIIHQTPAMMASWTAATVRARGSQVDLGFSS